MREKRERKSESKERKKRNRVKRERKKQSKERKQEWERKRNVFVKANDNHYYYNKKYSFSFLV